MSDERKVIGLVGSPNKDGLTNRLVSRALEGTARAGEATEMIRMPVTLSMLAVTTCCRCVIET